MGRGGRVIVDALTRRYCSKTIMAESGRTTRAFSFSSSQALSSSSFRLFHEPKPPMPKPIQSVLRSCSSLSKASPQDYWIFMGSNKEGEPEEGLKQKYSEMLSSVIPSEERERISSFDSMRPSMKGFVALLTKQEAVKLSGHPEVISVYPNYRKIHFQPTPQEAELGPESVPTTSEFDDFVIDLIELIDRPSAQSFPTQVDRPSQRHVGRDEHSET